MTIYDDMRGYVHVHDRNGWFDVTTETTPMYRMIDKADTENAKLRELARHMGACIHHLDRTDEDGGCVRCPYQTVEYDCGFEQRMAELGIEVEDA